MKFGQLVAAAHGHRPPSLLPTRRIRTQAAAYFYWANRRILLGKGIRGAGARAIDRILAAMRARRQCDTLAPRFLFCRCVNISRNLPRCGLDSPWTAQKTCRTCSTVISADFFPQPPLLGDQEVMGQQC